VHGSRMRSKHASAVAVQGPDCGCATETVAIVAANVERGSKNERLANESLEAGSQNQSS
jgi:hypothetical protein